MALVAVTVAALWGCDSTPQVRFHTADDYPERLSEWGVVTRSGSSLRLGRGAIPYDVNTPLFSDYALKLRTLHLPDDEAMAYREPAAFEFPVGSIVTKTFFYPVRDGVLQTAEWDGDVQALDLADHRLVETRLLVRQRDGWDALPYVWDGDDAYLAVTGTVEPLRVAQDGAVQEVPYVVPARSECAGCHATDHSSGELRLIGLKARHLNRPYAGRGANQLRAWAARGHLTGLPALPEVPRNAVWNDSKQSVAARARAYLDSNCGHCHNRRGPADTSGLLLDAGTERFRSLGVCKPPIAAGRGTGGRPYSIVPGAPDASILLYRMETTDPATRMPETGRALTHHEGVRLIRRWIEDLPGECV
ncbi:MAG: SO2930 family diheme c-type cytochrome [Pseudomonadota bacterium]